MLIKKEHSFGILKDFSPIFIPKDIPKLIGRKLLPEKIITFATVNYVDHIKALIQCRNTGNCIVVIPNEEIYQFYFRGLHLHLAFAFNKGFYKVKERWPVVYETPSLPTDQIISKTIKFYVHGLGEENGHEISDPQILPV